MRSVSYRLADFENKKLVIPIGFVGENEFTKVNIDCQKVFKDHPNAVATLAVASPSGEEYPATVTRDGDIVTWEVTASDLTAKGNGAIQLTFTDGTKVGKEYKARIYVEDSIGGSGAVPTPVQTWIEQANETLAEVEQAAEHAPIIDENGYWATWDIETEQYVSTGTKASGDPEDLIDDTYPALDKTFSSSKIDEMNTQLLSAIHGKTDVFTDTIIGEIAHITDGAENLPVTELEFEIVPIQAGSGVPSVNNFREITGYTGASFKQSDADLNNPTTTSISWQTEAGTVYYAKYNLLTGKMKVTHKGYILAFSDMNNNEDYPGWNGVTGLRDCYVGVNGGATITLCNIFPPEKNTANIRINTNGINNVVFIPKSILGVSGQTEAKTRFAGKNLVFISPLITPVTIDFEPLTGIKTVLGENNFWSNTGETKVTYYCNTKKFVEKEAEKTVDPIDTSFFESINYFNQNDAEFRQGMYVNGYGVITEANETNSIIIPVKPNTDYIFYIPNINRGYVATSITDEFDPGETYHLVKDISVDNVPVHFTTDNVAKFAFIYFFNGSIYDYDANKGQAVINIGTYTGTHRPVISNEYLPDGVCNVLNGANILIFGDSITDCCDLTTNSNKETTAYSWRNPSNSYTKDGTTINYSMWAKILKESQITGEIRNYAKSGAGYKTASRTSGNERQNLHYQIDIAMNDLDNPHNVFAVNDYVPDVVILALGTNDGNPNDTYDSAMQKTVLKTDGYSIDVDATIANLDETKFCESARKAFMRIKEAFPVAQIYVVLPLQTASNDTNLGNIHSYLKQMAERYGAIIVDGTMNSGITRDFNIKDSLGVYLKDGLHPNEKGQNLLARLIITSLKANYMPFGYGFNQ